MTKRRTAAPAGVRSGSWTGTSRSQTARDRADGAGPSGSGAVPAGPRRETRPAPRSRSRHHPERLLAAHGRPRGSGARTAGGRTGAEGPAGSAGSVTAGVVLVVIAVAAAAGALAVTTHGFRPRPSSRTRLPLYSACGQASASILHRTDSRSRSCHVRRRTRPKCSPPSGWPGLPGPAPQPSSSKQATVREPARGYVNPNLLTRASPGVRLPRPAGLAGRRPHRGL